MQRGCVPPTAYPALGSHRSRVRLTPPACRHVSQVKNLSGEDVEAILNHLDTNKSGKVDFEEFWVWFKSSDISASTLANRYK